MDYQEVLDELFRWRDRLYWTRQGIDVIRAIEECLPRTLPGAQDAEPSEQAAGGPMARVQGSRHGMLPGSVAGAGALAAPRLEVGVRFREGKGAKK